MLLRAVSPVRSDVLDARRAQPVPAVLEIPSKDRPYDPSKARGSYSPSDSGVLTSSVRTQDSILNRVKHLLGGPGGEV